VDCDNPDPVMYSAIVPVSRELLDDGVAFRYSIQVAFDRWQHPWRYPDRNPFPKMDPVPWFTRAQTTFNEARARVVHCVDVLRNGVPEPAEEW
jgi:hypothetical protein